MITVIDVLVPVVRRSVFVPLLWSEIDVRIIIGQRPEAQTTNEN